MNYIYLALFIIIWCSFFGWLFFKVETGAIMKTNVEISGKGKDTVIRHYNDKHEIIGYSDKNYSFTCKRDKDGDMINYQNTYGETL